MNYCFVLGIYHIGGAERQALILAQNLFENNNKIFFIAFEDGPLKVKLNEKGFVAKVIDWSEKSGTFCPGLIGKLITRVGQIYSFVQYVRLNHIDILLPYTITPNVRCGLLHKFAGVRICIWNQRDAGLGIQTTIIQRMAAWMTPVFVSNSEEGVQYLTRMLKVPSSRIHVVYNAIEPFSVNRSDKKGFLKTWGIKPKSFVTCMIANLSSHKDHATIIRSWAVFLNKRNSPDSAHLLLAGSFGDKHKDIAEQIRSYNLFEAIHLTGFINEINELIGACDLAAFSSRSEGCPNGVLECMASALAIVGTDIVSIRRVVSSENLPFLSAAGDYNSMGDSFCKLESDPLLRKTIGEANYRFVNERFSPDFLFQKTAKIIKENI